MPLHNAGLYVDDCSKDNFFTIASKYVSYSVKAFTQEDKASCTANDMALSESTFYLCKVI